MFRNFPSDGKMLPTMHSLQPQSWSDVLLSVCYCIDTLWAFIVLLRACITQIYQVTTDNEIGSWINKQTSYQSKSYYRATRLGSTGLPAQLLRSYQIWQLFDFCHTPSSNVIGWYDNFIASCFDISFWCEHHAANPLFTAASIWNDVTRPLVCEYAIVTIFKHWIRENFHYIQILIQIGDLG